MRGLCVCEKVSASIYPKKPPDERSLTSKIQIRAGQRDPFVTHTKKCEGHIPPYQKSLLFYLCINYIRCEYTQENIYIQLNEDTKFLGLVTIFFL
ncbi:UNVERIFIED_CONTAM: hypothetical protein NCL1_06184 [Trichonephila clavipes]